MSSNKVDKITGELVTLASGSRMWIGSKAAHDAAVQAGTMPNNCLLAILDDWQDSTVDVVEEDNMHPVTSNATYVRTEEIEDEISDIVNAYGSKNVLYNYQTTKTLNGITFTIKDDGTVIANGTATAITTFMITRKMKLKKYTLTGCPSGGGTSTYYLQLRIFNNDSWYMGRNDTGNGVSVSDTDLENANQLYVAIIVANGAVLSNVEFKPMIRMASIKDSTYEPYVPTNRQLLSHYDNGILGAKNLLPNIASSKTENGLTFTANSDGSVKVNGTATSNTYFRLDFIDSINNAVFDVRNLIGKSLIASVKDVASGIAISTGYFKSDGTYGNLETGIQTSREVVYPSDAIKARTFLSVANGTTLNNVTVYPMIRLASDSDTTYQPYAKTNKQLTDNAETVNNEIYDIVNVYGSKNLCPTFASGSMAGVTYTVNSDGSITAVGTSNDSTGFGIKSGVNLPNGKYIMSAGADASTDLRFIVKIIKGGTTNYYEVDSANKEVSFTVNDPDSLDIYVRTNGGNVSINGTLYPMIRCASISDNTYVPYAKTNRELTEALTVSKGAPTANTDYIASSDLHYEKYGKVVHVFGNFETNTAILGTDSLVTLFTNLPNSNGGMNGTSSQYTLCLLHDNTNDGLSYRCFVSNEGKLVSRYKAIPIGTYFADFTYICQ